MKYKMIERNLAEHGMGIDKISEADELVFLDDQLLVNDILRKDKRSIRIQNAENKKNRNKRLYSMSGDVERYAHRFWYDVDDRVNIAPVFASGNEPVAFIKKSRKNGFKKVINKVENRKVRYQKIEITADEQIVGGITVADEIEEYSDTFRDVTIGKMCHDFFSEDWEDYVTKKWVELYFKKRELENSIYELKAEIEKIKAEMNQW